ncbi:unnamed protein product [Owenia fusiformis]|uniref:Cytochrome P450 n=1 Tax=Owenia fusiformis TaxID=6347 RepID=A0A8S4PVB2_OWEFU|nr:unnamed protein product [Owenia fusiformis]
MKGTRLSLTKGLPTYNSLRTVYGQHQVNQLNRSESLSVPDASKCPFTQSVSPSEDPLKRPTKAYRESLEKYTGLENARPYALMPGPKGYPLIGSLLEYIKKDGLKFNKMFEVMQSRAREYGPIYKEHIAQNTSVVVTDPLEYSKLMRHEANVKYPHRIEMEPLAHYRRVRGLSLGLVSAQGEEWYKYRKVVNKKMLRPKEVMEYIPGMDEVATEFSQRMKKLLDSKGEVDNLENELFKWSLESIGTVLFEERIGCLNDPPPQLAKDFISNLMGFFKYLQPLMYNVPIYKIYPVDKWKKYTAHADNVMAIGQQFVDKKAESLMRREKDGTVARYERDGSVPFLTYMLSQTSLTLEEANSNVIDLMSGAVETTSNATIWTLYCLALNPAVQEKMHQETIKVLPNKAPITGKTLAQLPYVKAVLKEVFRIYPITYSTSRIIHEDIEMGGYRIPAGSHVQANLYGMGHESALFPEPEEFRPERWLRGNTDRELQAFTNLPFGHGSRMCIGRRFAEQEVYIAVTKLIQDFRVEYHHEPIEPVLNTVMTPDRPVKLTFIPRN